jgi:two-component system, cell cycle response regulator CtrA
LVDLDAKNAKVHGEQVHLTSKEYQILELLALRKGSTLTKDMFLNHLYGGTNEPDAKIIDVFVCKLRKKLASASGGEDYIETVWGRGYTLRKSSEQLPASLSCDLPVETENSIIDAGTGSGVAVR